MARDPSFPLYAQDFLIDVIQLPDELVGAYIRLLCVMWINGFCYDSAIELAMISPLAKKVLERIPDKFTFHQNGTVTNNRLEKERTKRIKNRELRSVAGKKGAKIRWQTDSKDDDKGNGKKIAKEKDNDNEYEYEDEIEDIRRNKNKKFEKEKSIFDESREIFPGTKRGLDTEFDNLNKHKDWRKVLPLIKPAIENQIEWRKKKGFVPEWKNFKTWINQRCWEDELPEIKSNKPAKEKEYPYRCPDHPKWVIDSTKGTSYSCRVEGCQKDMVIDGIDPKGNIYQQVLDKIKIESN